MLIPKRSSGTTAQSLSQLIDAQITDPQPGQALNWNGSAWVNVTPGSATHAGTVIAVDPTYNTVTVSFAGGGSASNVPCFTSTLPLVGSTVLCEVMSNGNTVVTGLLLVPFNLASIPNLTAWYDAADLGTYAQSGPISSWADKSGNSHDATLISGVPGPSFATGAMAGRNVMQFGQGGRSGLVLPLAATPSTNFTVFVVAKLHATTELNNNVILCGSQDSSTVIQTANGNTTVWNGTALTTSGPAIETAFQETVVFGTTGALRINGVSLATGSTGTTSLLPIYIGSFGEVLSGRDYRSVVDIAELAVFSGTVATENIAKIETYLKAKWGTP